MNKPGVTTIERTCMSCKKIIILEVPSEEWREYVEGKKLVQNAIPSLTPGQREVLISGICEPCFDKLFGEGE